MSTLLLNESITLEEKIKEFLVSELDYLWEDTIEVIDNLLEDELEEVNEWITLMEQYPMEWAEAPACINQFF